MLVNWLGLVALSVLPLVDGVDLVNERTMIFPLSATPQARWQYREVRLHISSDRGKTWRQVQTGKLTDPNMIVTVPHWGLHWFTLQLVDHQGALAPSDPTQFTALRKVIVYPFVLPQSHSAAKAPVDELQALRAEVEQLRRRVRELEAERTKQPPP